MFEPIEIKFKEQSLKVPANSVFGLIAAIEEHITIAELYSNPKNTAIARAYASAVNYAGGQATTSEVYTMLFDNDGALNIRNAIQSLILIMIPPEHLRDKSAGDSSEKKDQGD